MVVTSRRIYLTWIYSSKFTYILSFCVFGIIQFYIIILSFYLVVKAFSGQNGFNDLQANSVGEFVGKFFNSNSGVSRISLLWIFIFGLIVLAYYHCACGNFRSLFCCVDHVS